jgi:uncharacterized protein
MKQLLYKAISFIDQQKKEEIRMKKNIILLIVCILILVSFAGCFEEEKKSENNDSSDDNVSTQLNVTTSPFLWKIEGDIPSYLYGTVHIREDEILTLPDIVFELILSSDKVYTETKMDYSTIVDSTMLSMLPKGQTVDNIIPENVIEKLNNFFTEKNLTQFEINYLKSLKVWAVASAVVQYSDSDKEDVNQPVLDQYIWNIATTNSVEISGLETVEEQLNIFNNLTTEEQVKLLNDSLDYVNEIEENGDYYIDIYQREYLKGNINSILDLEYSDFDKNDPLDKKIEKKVLSDRNNNLTTRIINNITKNPDKQFFFAIGAAHFVGNKSIISLLEDRGYTVTRVTFDECDICDNNETKIEDRCYVPYSKEYENDFT